MDHSSVLRLDPDAETEGGWTLNRMTHGTSAPNGLLMSADERTLYLVQSDYQGVRDLRAISSETTTRWEISLYCTSLGRISGEYTGDWTACAWTPKGISSPAVDGGRLDRDR